MKEYRVFCLDGVNRFVRAETIEADNDEIAIEKARSVAGDCIHFEVWQHDRIVKRSVDEDGAD